MAKTIGSLELVHAKPFDLLPSDYQLTCGHCLPDADVSENQVMLRRQLFDHKAETNCRHCHKKMEFTVNGVVWQNMTLSSQASTRSHMPPRIKRQQLSIVKGEPLPDMGTCKHYKKSFRWLRFPCCGKGSHSSILFNVVGYSSMDFSVSM